MKKKFFWFAIFNWCFFVQNITLCSNQAVTYELSPGRFGDNLISYIHAKWISYKYHIPLLYKPFIYSDRLILHECEQRYADDCASNFAKKVTLSEKNCIDCQDSSSVLYIAPYFPESKYELRCGFGFDGLPWVFFVVNWNDKGFIDELKKVISPRSFVSIPRMHLPKDRVTVAVHLRKGGNHDTPETIPGFPLKFLPDEFYIEQIRKLYGMLNNASLYVYLFTDDNHPAKIMKKFSSQLSGLDIQFDCRKQGNSDTANVLEDFFTMGQFDCLIHSESNFSFIMSKLGNYLVSIFPDSFRKNNGKIIYDHVNTTISRNHPKAFLLKC